MRVSTIETDVETGRLIEVKVTLPAETVAERSIAVGTVLAYTGAARGVRDEREVVEVAVVEIRDHPLGSEITARPKGKAA